MKISMWRSIPDFKIRSKADVQTLFDKCFMNDSVYRFIVSPEKVITVYKEKDGVVHVTVKFGDIYNVFNPEVVVYDNDSINEIWKARKIINAKLFGRD